MDKHSKDSSSQWELPNSTEAAERLSSQLLEKARRQGFHEEDLFAIHLALEEAFVNTVKHGNQSDPNKQVFIRCSVTSEKFDITITDQGPGFDPTGLPDPRCRENLCKSSGRGILLIRAYMDQVDYNPKGNQIHMVKLKGGSGPPEDPPTKCECQ